ncbi:CshA/CshB family fibrillar adhesin-related protein [Glutamicibacter sp. MNS18]|uniref:CshA/CshB family fibrillar adhesin-related protein n=1 Tax=Glutamicibacter sp. MNS18 TaxID=2989817 RepID=UPI002236372D|nr:CshA/CshB family fibrillar adhesin-related protein [Glutamicibacter sp. MNS18]MCW4466131.1 CshA/CshB family fibrillar adhesin-related protein [Glutamicibacter sp. MNS18]
MLLQSTRVSTVRPRRPRRIVAALLELLLAVVGLQGVQLATSADAKARYAVDGVGTYKGLIDWIEWGAHKEIVRDGKVARTERTIGGQVLATSCTLGNITGGGTDPLSAYRPGTWKNDALDNMYNIGGQNGSNQLIAGLANRNDGQTVDFSVSCDTTLNGVSVPMAGLVIADAESSNATKAEYVQATPHLSADWRIIERFRACSYDMNAIVTGTTLRLSPVSNSECAGGPLGIAFMEGAHGANVAVKGEGTSAVAIGVVFEADFGDAPASYGEAGALFQRSWSGTPLPQGTTSVFKQGLLSSPQAPNTRLGARIDADSGHQPSATADADDTDGDDDEDAVGALGTIHAVPGQSFTQSNVACTGPGYVAGWLDWNNNGAFDPKEGSTRVQCTGSSVAVSWTVPEDASTTAGTASSFLRLRIAATQAELAQPTGITATGEVEDHALRIATPTLGIQKSISQRADASDQFVLALSEGHTALGTASTTGSAVGVQSRQIEPVGVLPGRTYTFSEAMAPGSGSVLGDYTSRYQCTARYANGTSTILGSGDTVQGTVTVPAYQASLGAPAITCVFTNDPRPAELTLHKQWIVNGEPLEHGEQPEGLEAAARLAVNGAAASEVQWGTATGNMLTGDTVRIDEQTRVADYLPGCLLLEQRVSALGEQATDKSLPLDTKLAPGRNSIGITNEVQCDTTLFLEKTAAGEETDPAQWTVSAVDNSGTAVVSGQGSGSVRVAAGTRLFLAESGGPAEWIQDDERTAEERDSSPRATGSWQCQAVDGQGRALDGVLAERAGLDGTLTPGLGTSTRCEAVNRTAHLALLKVVQNTNGTGTAEPGDWQLSATPAAGVQGLQPREVAGALAIDGNSFPVRPGHVYELDERGPGGYTRVALEKFTGNDPRDPAQLADAANWTAAQGPGISVETGKLAVYRFVNREVMAFALPLTGATGSWPYLGGGGALLAMALLAGWLLRRRTKRQHSS